MGKVYSDLNGQFDSDTLFDLTSKKVLHEIYQWHSLSPEDEELPSLSTNLESSTLKMAMCRQIDEFYDIIFQVEDKFLKGNTTILKARS